MADPNLNVGCNGKPVAGGSGIGWNNVIQNQNVIIDLAVQNMAAQLAQQIITNTNDALKKEVVKIPEEREKGRRTQFQHLNSSPNQN
jgi:hypothetical protein